LANAQKTYIDELAIAIAIAITIAIRAWKQTASSRAERVMYGLQSEAAAPFSRYVLFVYSAAEIKSNKKP
jgi:hypothetical protein